MTGTTTMASGGGLYTTTYLSRPSERALTKFHGAEQGAACAGKPVTKATEPTRYAATYPLDKKD